MTKKKTSVKQKMLLKYEEIYKNNLNANNKTWSLPPTIISKICNYLPISDLIIIATVSTTMKNIVYANSRWIYLLKLLNIWDNQKAIELEDEENNLEDENKKNELETLSVGEIKHNKNNNVPISNTIFDLDTEKELEQKAINDNNNSLMDLMDFSEESINNNINNSKFSCLKITPFSSNSILNVYDNKLFLPNKAREEFGKIYKILNPIYLGLTSLENNFSYSSIFVNQLDQSKLLHNILLFTKVTENRIDSSERLKKLNQIVTMFENQFVDEFMEASQKIPLDKKKINHAVVILNNLNNGSALVKYYVNHHLNEINDYILDPNSCFFQDGSYNIKSVENMLTKISDFINNQNKEINNLFMDNLNIIIPLLDAIFDNILKKFITDTIIHAKENALQNPEKNNNTYLFLFSSLFIKLLIFCDNLQESQNSQGELANYAFQLVIECFEPYISDYLDDEVAAYRHKAQLIVTEWNQYIENEGMKTEQLLRSKIDRKQEKIDFITSFKKMIKMPVNVLQNSVSSTNIISTENSNNGSETNNIEHDSNTSGEFKNVINNKDSPELPKTEMAAQIAIMNSQLEGIRTLISLETAVNLIEYGKKSLQRLSVFTQVGGKLGTETRLHCEAIFVVLVQYLGMQHIKNGFERAISHLDHYSERKQRGEQASSIESPMYKFLELVNVGDLMQQMIEIFYERELVSHKLIKNQDFLSSAVTEKRKFEQMLDENVALGLSKGIDVLELSTESICTTLQLASDYNPPPRELKVATIGIGAMDLSPTKAALSVIELLKTHIDILDGATDSGVLDVFRNEIGMRLFGIICKRIKHTTISIEGAPTFISDMNAYYDFIATLQQRTLLEYFGALKTLGQMYLIDTSDAKSIGMMVGDVSRFGNVFTAEELYAFVQQRADWPFVRKAVEKVMYGLTDCIII